MPVLTYTNTRNNWSEVGSRACRAVHDGLVDIPTGRPRIVPIEIDVHPGRSSTRFIPKRGTVQVNGYAPRPGIRGENTFTPMHTGIGMTTEIVAEKVSALMVSEQYEELGRYEQDAENELAQLMAILFATQSKMQRAAVRVTNGVGLRNNPQRRATINAYSRAR